ncbi:MAG TPA: calcium/sodium antiporter [bacterium]|nr:calcium/sodium antiporter [bacterium]HQO91438.1 calcium/sodium antiporter [bacterium]
MFLPILAVVAGLALLVWSADKFVDGSAAVARHFGVSPLIIGMVIVGFGTSVPEMLVSAISSFQGNPGIALGNAYGSNIANIALILGMTALISPIAVHSSILKKELPILVGVTFLAVFHIWDNTVTRFEAVIMLVVFAGIMAWTIKTELNNRQDNLLKELEKEVPPAQPVTRAFFWVVTGLVFLLVSSRALVWGSVEIAHFFGVSDIIIGLTVVAVGTSLPELASSLTAIKKKEHDIALGNVLGSNLFNTLAVVGIAGTINPMTVPHEVLTRDMTVMTALTLSIFLFGWNFGKGGRINRYEGALLLLAYAGYTAYLIHFSFIK